MSQSRRSFLEELPPAPHEHVHSIPVANSTPAVSDAPKRRGRKPAHRRKRDWEATHRPHTFVGVPEQIRETIRDLAAYYRSEYGMVGGVDAVARELLNYALAEYAAGKLNMSPVQSQGKSALISYFGWSSASKTIPARKPQKKKTKPSAVTYRLPQEQVQSIRAIIVLEENKAAPMVIHLTLGQVMTRLLAHALNAFQAGDWVLDTIPVMTVQGLKGEARS
jgi:hypothetical protein